MSRLHRGRRSPSRTRRITPRKQGRRAGRWAAVAIAGMVAAFFAGQKISELNFGGITGKVVHQQVAVSTIAVDDEFRGTVKRIVDGDTFWISSADVRIRVWALDAPERDMPGFGAATEALRRLIDGRSLTCRTRDIDRFGRIVGQCFLQDGRDITRAMIDTGTAREFCRFSGNHYGTCTQ